MQGKTFPFSFGKYDAPTKLCGIYRIVNTKTGKSYVGQTKGPKGFSGRWTDHRTNLKNNKHHSIHLQRSYNRHGPELFFFEILEVCDRAKDLRQAEDFWMKEFDSIRNGYNIVGYTEDDLKIQVCYYRPQIEFELIDPTGKRIRGPDLKRFSTDNNLSFTYLKKVLEGELHQHKGYLSPNYKFLARNKYAIISPRGDTYSFSDIKKFAKDHSLNWRLLHRALVGSIPHHKGWHRENPTEEHSKIINSYIKLRQPFKIMKDGILIEGDSISNFCKKNKLVAAVMRQLIDGVRFNYLGYKKYIPDGEHTHQLVSPNGEIFYFSIIAEFCREKGLSVSSVYEVIKGNREDYRGWKLLT